MAEFPKILLVDDDKEIVRGLTLRLLNSGYSVTTAANGKTGFELALASQPDAIILDVRMPVMDGLKTLEKLRQAGRTKGIPVIMLSASVVEKSNAFDLGARYFLEKPYDAQKLLAALESVLTSSVVASSRNCGSQQQVT